MSPAHAQTRRSRPAVPTLRADSAETMKMPEPIIEPTTSIAPSNGPISRCGRPVLGICSRDDARIGARRQPEIFRTPSREDPMKALMQETPLTLTHVLWRAEKLFGRKEMVTRVDGGVTRRTYGEA